jgi:hypothetical protein
MVCLFCALFNTDEAFKVRCLFAVKLVLFSLYIINAGFYVTDFGQHYAFALPSVLFVFFACPR